MNNSVIENELREVIHQLPLPQQQQVLEYVRFLIEEGCEKVDEDEW